jgi:hypothetical protein
MIYGLRQAWLAPLDKKITNSGDIVCFDARSGDFMIDQAERARLEERIRLELDQVASGNSANVAGAIETARDLGIVSLALTGQQGGRMAEIADHMIRAPATRTNSIQEMHIVIGHMLCGFIEETLC